MGDADNTEIQHVRETADNADTADTGNTDGIEVTDHGDREILVHLRGRIGEALRPRLDAAVERIALLNGIDGHDRVVVDVREVAELEHAGLCFLSALTHQGEHHGYDVALAMVNEQTERALDAAHWPHRPIMTGSW